MACAYLLLHAMLIRTQSHSSNSSSSTCSVVQSNCAAGRQAFVHEYDVSCGHDVWHMILRVCVGASVSLLETQKPARVAGGAWVQLSTAHSQHMCGKLLLLPNVPLFDIVLVLMGFGCELAHCHALEAHTCR
jgi:hypothetical protein